LSYLALGLFVLACGWNVYRDFLPTRAVAIRVQGHPQHFGAVLAAGYLVLVAISLHAAAAPFDWYVDLVSTVSNLSPPSLDAALTSSPPSTLVSGNGRLSTFQSLLAITLWSGVLSLTLPALMNLPYKLSSRLRLLAVWRRLDEVEQLLIEVMEDEVSLAVTLSTGKVYIGFPLEADTGSRELSWIRLQPLASGFRDAEGEFHAKTGYQIAYDALAGTQSGLSKDDFRVVLPLSSIVSLQKFDLAFYVSHFLAANDVTPDAKDERIGGVTSDPGQLPSLPSDEISDVWLRRLPAAYLLFLTLTIVLLGLHSWVLVFTTEICAAVLFAVWERDLPD
jgi:hypothetical protein